MIYRIHLDINDGINAVIILMSTHVRKWAEKKVAAIISCGPQIVYCSWKFSLHLKLVVKSLSLLFSLVLCSSIPVIG